MVEPPKKMMCSKKDVRSQALAMPSHIRHAIFDQIKQPVVFTGYILNEDHSNNHWECMKWKEEDWEKLFGQEKLTLRVNKVVDCERLSAPQWEGNCMKALMTYSEIREWAKNQDGKTLNKCKTTCGKEIHSQDNWIYFDYYYMKDLINMEKIDKAIEWSKFGFPERGAKDSTIWLGTCGANTPCHIDTYGCNLVAQIKGRKRWTLFPKEQSTFLYSTRVPYEESSIYSEVGFPSPNISSHPNLMQSTPYVVTLEPGDVLFVPQHWWHFVEHLDFSISINTWLELPQDEIERTKEAIVMYQIGSLCQGIDDPLVLRSVVNPNMLNLLELSSEQLLKAVSDQILSERRERILCDENVDSQLSDNDYDKSDFIRELIMKYGNLRIEELMKKWFVDNNIQNVEKMTYLDYSYITNRPVSKSKSEKNQSSSLKSKCSTFEINQNENIKSDESTLNAEINKFKILVNSFCDDRVLEVLKNVLTEKLQQSF
ncbi:unnamed protein product, partial [Meganyctiphanes norvegica]